MRSIFDHSSDEDSTNKKSIKDDLINFKSADVATEAKLQRLKHLLASGGCSNEKSAVLSSLKRPSLGNFTIPAPSSACTRSPVRKNHENRLYPRLSSSSSDCEKFLANFQAETACVKGKGTTLGESVQSPSKPHHTNHRRLTEQDEEIVREFDPLLIQLNDERENSVLWTDRDFDTSFIFRRRKSESDKHKPNGNNSEQSESAQHPIKSIQLNKNWMKNIRSRIPRNELSLREMVLKLNSPSSAMLNDVNWTNRVIISPRVSYPLPNGLTSVKLVVNRQNMQNCSTSVSPSRTKSFESGVTANSFEPVLFTCDVDSHVEQIIGHVIYSSAEIVDRNVKIEQFSIKVRGLDEYLIPLTRLSDYAYVHNCAKFGKDVDLDLVRLPNFCLEHKTADKYAVDLNFEDFSGVKESDLAIALEILQNETQKLIESFQNGANFSDITRYSGMLQSIKMICTMLHNIQPLDLVQALKQLVDVCEKAAEERKTKCTLRQISGEITRSAVKSCNDAAPSLNRSINAVMQSLQKFLNVYVASSSVRFKFAMENGGEFFTIENIDSKSVREIVDLEENLLIRLESIYNLPIDWFAKYERFYVVCYLTYGLSEISGAIKTEPAQIVKNYGDFLQIDQWLTFDRNLICTLPRESRICLVLFGTKIELEPNENSSPQQNDQSQSGPSNVNAPVPIRSIVEVELCWASCPLFDSDRFLAQGSFYLPTSFTLSVEAWGPSPCLSSLNKTAPVFAIQLPSFDFKYRFPVASGDVNFLSSEPEPENSSMKSLCKSFLSLDYDQQQLLEDIVQHGSILDIDDKELLWEKRFYLTEKPEALPLVIKSALSWDWACVGNIRTLLACWRPLDAGRAVELLLPEYPDEHVRSKAIFWLERYGPDELCNILSQLTEALCFEMYENSSLAELLLNFALQNRRFAFSLFWQLEERKYRADPFSKRCSNIQLCLVYLLGPEFQNMTKFQARLIHRLDELALDFKACKESERKKFLNLRANQLDGELLSCNVNLPVYPSVVATGVDWQKCRFFASLTLPVKICFRTINSELTYDVLNKLGDDLRQDILVLQLLRLMDNIWLKDGLDLRMLVYKCMSTGTKKGIIEMVPDCKTLREIHVLEGGMTGALKDNLIGKWLQKQNPCELDYLSALNNFRRSCAGWCVCTFILGIGDRHNDNIMLTCKGHVFHIDFGKYLGDTENFGSFKSFVKLFRDRTPFILTSDMVDVINCGETKATTFFQDFVDYCCKAFNIVRNNHSIFINLMKLMLRANVPGLTEEAVKFVCANLWLDHSDSEASNRFTRMIEESMNNKFPKWNFLVHTIAQQRKAKHGARDTTRLSFVPNTYSADSDGKLESIKLIACEKWKIPEKVYMYKIRVNRVNVRIPAFIFRSYKELNEFSDCLCLRFPLSKLPILPKDRGLGRTNVREIAERRTPFVTDFLKALFSANEDFANCDLVYTFFHSILRDDPTYSTNKLADSGRPDLAELNVQSAEIRGELKLCIEYKKNCLEIFVQHAKNLTLVNSSILPDSYVKCYLRPDFNRRSKRKTRIIRKAQNPTYNEALIYPWTLEMLMDKVLEITVWQSDVLKENSFIGGIQLDMKDLLRSPNKKLSQWFKLGNIVSKHN